MHSAVFGENQTQPISTNTSHHQSSTVVEGVTIWVCLAVTGPGHLGVIKSERPSVRQAKLGQN